MRAGGAPVGVGELLAAHRALAAVDCASRVDAYFALRAALCSPRAALSLFAEAFAAVFAVEDDARDPLEQLGRIERAVLPRLGIPAEPDPQSVELGDAPVPSAYSDEELLREKDFGEYSDDERALARALLARLARRS